MAPHGERSDRIRDLARDLGRLDHMSSDLRKYLGPEMGALNVKQTEAIITLTEAVRGIIQALAALNKEMSGFTVEDGEFLLTMGDAAIRMKKNGNLQIKGNDIDVRGAGNIQIKAGRDIDLNASKDVEIKAAKELRLKGEKVL
jgi:hypothetical protein